VLLILSALCGYVRQIGRPKQY